MVLRVLWPQGFLFRQDEAEHLTDSLAVSQHGERPAHAWPSSAGVPNGPGYLYFLAAVTRFTDDPRAAQAALTLLNCLALAAAVPLARRWLPAPRDAEVAVALYATSPVAIWFSRKIWDPCLLPPLAVAALLAATRLRERPGSRAGLVLLPLLAVIVQVHQSAVVFAALLLGVSAPALWRGSRPALAAGAAAAVAIVLPYARFLGGVVSAGAVAVRSRAAWPDVDVLTNLLLDVTGHNLLQTAGFAAGGILRWPFPPIGLVAQLLAVPFAIPFALGYAEAVRPRTGTLSPAARPVVLTLGIGLPAAFLLARVQGAAHYYLTLWPVLFALLVAGYRRAAASRSAFLRRLPSPSLLAAVGVVNWLLFQSYISIHHGSPNYGLPYGALVQAATEVRASARAVGLGTPDAPLHLGVDLPRDRGPLPHQYRYVLERMGVVVRPPAAGEVPDLTLHVHWGDDRPVVLGPVPIGRWEVRPGGS